MSAIEARTFKQAFDDARSAMFLNDTGASAGGVPDVYTDTRLLPTGAFVHAEIQDEWAKRGIPILETVRNDLTYTAGQETIPIPNTISDTFQAPLELWEKDPNNANLWLQMRRVDRIPPPLQTQLPFLGIWEWRDGSIIVLPCSSNRTIWCRYRIQVGYPTNAPTDTMGSEGFYWALVAGVAYYAAVGTERDIIRNNAGPIYRKRTLDAIQIASRDRQVINYRQQSTRNMDRPLWRGPTSSTP